MKKKNKKALIKITISVVLFGLIIWKVDFASVWETIKLMNPAYIPLLILFLVLNYIVSSIRWKFLLIHKNSEKVSVSYLVYLYFIGSFFNNFMPTSIGGDVYKILALGNKIKSKTDAFVATFMERFTGMVALILISYFGLVQTLDFWLEQLPKTISENDTYVFLFKLVLFFGFWIGAFVAFASLKFFAKIVPIAKRVYDSLMVYKKENKVLLIAFLTSFVVQLLAIFTQYFVFLSLGIKLPLNYVLFIFPVITLASFFVPSLNGLGVQDALYMQMFLSVGVSSTTALSASIIYHLSRLAVSLVGGVLYAFDKAD